MSRPAYNGECSGDRYSLRQEIGSLFKFAAEFALFWKYLIFLSGDYSFPFLRLNYLSRSGILSFGDNSAWHNGTRLAS